MNEPIQADPSTQDSAPPSGDSQVAPVSAPPDSNQSDTAEAGAGSTAETPPHENVPAETAQPDSLTPPKSVASTTQSPEVVDAESYKRLRDEKSQWGRQKSQWERQIADVQKNYEQTRSQLAQFQCPTLA